MSCRICSRPGSVPTPTPIVTAIMQLTVRSMTALMRTTRWRRHLQLKVGTDAEREGEFLEEPSTRRWSKISRTRCVLVHLLEKASRAIPLIVDRIAGRHAQQRREVRVKKERSLLSIIPVVPDVDLHRP